MKKILVRAGMSPLKAHSPAQVLANNLIGNNIGNMLFPHSISRCLMTEGTEISTLVVRGDYPERVLREIDEQYDCLILPFANAFRISFIKDLRATTRLIRSLHIPCVVVGIGAQASLGKQLVHDELAEASREFVAAVLEKSAKIGLRGEFTAEYLTGLGFRAERDFTVIGCPSMYLYGEKLPEMQATGLTERSSVSINSKIQLPGRFHEFLYRSKQALPNYHYVPQVIQEILLMYQGWKLPGDFVKKVPVHFPARWDDAEYVRDRGRSFVDVPSWLAYLGEKDFSFGSRIHGNIAAILAGTPCFIVVSDQRIRELAEYHRIPHILMSELKKDTSIFQLYEQADFSQIAKGHRERFAHYLDFLQENGLETIFDGGASPEEPPFDRALKAAFTQTTTLTPLASLEGAERRERLREMSQGRINYLRGKKYIKRKWRGVDIE